MKFFDPQGGIEKTAHKLPHWQQGEVAIFVTFRLADSLPRELLDDWLRAREAFFAANPPPWDDITEACYHGQFSDKLDEHLDAAHGSFALRDPRLAQIVPDRLHHFDGQRYDLWSYVIMLQSRPRYLHPLRRRIPPRHASRLERRFEPFHS